ncbi:MAG: hypothetical protein ABSA08_05670 [Acidimicrobiales bacterium]|jgi:hypothetical protein
MPTLWTPEGEHGVPDLPGDTAPEKAEKKPAAEPTEEQLAAERAAIERELAAAPAEDIVANHCFGLFQLAALYLTQSPPDLAKAKLAIDALGAVVDTLGDRLGESAPTLQGALAQIRLAFVELTGTAVATPADADGTKGGAPPG